MWTILASEFLRHDNIKHLCPFVGSVKYPVAKLTKSGQYWHNSKEEKLVSIWVIVICITVFFYWKPTILPMVSELVRLVVIFFFFMKTFGLHHRHFFATDVCLNAKKYLNNTWYLTLKFHGELPYLILWSWNTTKIVYFTSLLWCLIYIIYSFKGGLRSGCLRGVYYVCWCKMTF